MADAKMLRIQEKTGAQANVGETSLSVNPMDAGEGGTPALTALPSEKAMDALQNKPAFSQWQRAFILHEILGPPIGKRRRR